MAIKKPIKQPAREEQKQTQQRQARPPRQPDPEPEAEGGSYEDEFDAAKPGGGFMAPGNHEAYIVAFELEGDPDDVNEDLKAKVTYEGAEDQGEGIEGKALSQWYTLRKDGKVHQGIGFLKKDLEILGHEEAKFADIKGGLLDDVVTERPRVVINVKQNGQYTNAYLQGLAEG